MINILHVVLGLQVGGLERVVIDLIDNYSSSIHSYVVCLEDEGELAASCKSSGLYAFHKKPGISLVVMMRLRSLARKLNIDLIHTHNTAPHFHGAVAGMLAGIPVIHTKHGRNRSLGVKKIILYRLSALLTRKIVAVSQNAANDCIILEGIPAQKVMIIHNGIDTRLYLPAKRYPTSSDDVCTIGIVARLAPEKDHMTLLRACAILRDKQVSFHLVIIGDGPLRGELELTVRDLDLLEIVEFTGVRHDIEVQLKRLDIFVLSSITEGISLTLLEAMATALPIIATDVGGNPEVVVNGSTGFLVPPNNPEAMAQKLSQLMVDCHLRKLLGENGRKRVEEQFDIRRTAGMYEQLYGEVLRSASR